MTDIELLKLARSEISDYTDMGHFRNPLVAEPYLVEGFQLGYRHAEKNLALELRRCKEEVRLLREKLWKEFKSNHVGYTNNHYQAADDDMKVVDMEIRTALEGIK